MNQGFNEVKTVNVDPKVGMPVERSVKGYPQKVAVTEVAPAKKEFGLGFPGSPITFWPNRPNKELIDPGDGKIRWNHES